MKTSIVLLALVIGCRAETESTPVPPPACSLSDCPESNGACRVPSCESRTCAIVDAPDGLLCWGKAEDVIHGECHLGTCATTDHSCVSAADCPPPVDPCKAPTCAGMVCGVSPVENGNGCTMPGGGQGLCVNGVCEGI